MPPQANVPQTPVEKSLVLGIAEIVLHIICLILCLIALVPAVFAIAAVNDLDDIFGVKFEHKDSYRAAAGWLVSVCFLAVIYHGLMNLIRLFYLTINIGRFFGYAITNAVLCVIFGLALLSGGIVNAKYAADNLDLYHNTTGTCQVLENSEVCTNIKNLYMAQGGAAVAAFFAVIIFIPVFIIAIICGVQKMRQGFYQKSINLSSAPYVQLPHNDY